MYFAEIPFSVDNFFHPTGKVIGAWRREDCWRVLGAFWPRNFMCTKNEGPWAIRRQHDPNPSGMNISWYKHHQSQAPGTNMSTALCTPATDTQVGGGGA